LWREISADKAGGHLAELTVSIGHTVQGNLLHAAEIDTKCGADVLDDKVGILLLDILRKLAVLKLGDTACGKVFAGHSVLWGFHAWTTISVSPSSIATTANARPATSSAATARVC